MPRLLYVPLKFRHPVKSSRLNQRLKRRPRSTSLYKKIPVFFFFLIFLVFCGFAILTGTRGFLPISRVECRSADGVISDGELNSWCSFLRGQLLGKSLVFLNGLSVAESVKKVFPAVFAVHLRRNWPSSVQSDFRKRQPVLAVYFTPEASASAQAENFYWVDREGVLFSKVEGILKVPLLYWPQATGEADLKLGSALGSAFGRFTVEVVSRLNALGLISTSLSEIPGGSLSVSLSDGMVVKFSSRKVAAEQVMVLQLIREKYRIEGKALKKVDLRFQDPVVEY